MSTDWYYLDKGEQQGPVSGNELRELADSATVKPWTSVRRTYKGESSPWTRAGAIQALLSEDVSDLLGPPICNDCGTAKPDGSCPNCEAEEVAPIQPEQPTEYEASEFSARASTPLADRETKNVRVVDINLPFSSVFGFAVQFAAANMIIGVVVYIVCFAGVQILGKTGAEVNWENVKNLPIVLLFLGMLAAALIFGLSGMSDKKR